MPNLGSLRYPGSVAHKYSSNILVSDRVENKADIDPKFIYNNLPEFMNKQRYIRNNDSPLIFKSKGIILNTSKRDDSKHNHGKFQYLAQSTAPKNTIAEDIGIKQKVNLNININYSPSNAQFINKNEGSRIIGINQPVSKLFINHIGAIWSFNN